MSRVAVDLLFTATVIVDQVVVQYRDADGPSMRDLHPEIDDGEFLVPVGPSYSTSPAC